MTGREMMDSIKRLYNSVATKAGQVLGAMKRRFKDSSSNGWLSDNTSIKFHVVYPLIILLVAGLITFILLLNPKNAQKKERVTALLPVNVVMAKRYNRPAIVVAKGFLAPSHQYKIITEVQGKVLRKSEKLEKGEIFDEGEVMFETDPYEYKMMLAARKADLARATQALEIEKALREAAIMEWDAIDDVNKHKRNRKLAWRDFNVESAIESYNMAHDALHSLENRISKTKFTSPCRALVLDHSVEEGQFLPMGQNVVNLACVDSYHIDAPILNSDIKWIKMPEEDRIYGSGATIVQKLDDDSTIARRGYVTSFSRALHPVTKMASVRIEVEDPLGINDPCMCNDKKSYIPMLLNGYVTAYINGKTIDDSIIIPEEALLEGDHVMVVDGDDKLQKKKVHVALKYIDHIIIDEGLEEGERVAIDRLPLSIAGTKAKPMLNS